MQFTIWTKNRGAPDSEAWPEEYNKPTDDPEQWATDTLIYFNSTRYPGEPARVLVKVVVEANGKDKAESRDRTDTFDKQVFDSYLRSKERRAAVVKKRQPIVREVLWTKRLVKPQ